MPSKSRRCVSSIKTSKVGTDGVDSILQETAEWLILQQYKKDERNGDQCRKIGDQSHGCADAVQKQIDRQSKHQIVKEDVISKDALNYGIPHKSNICDHKAS